MVRSRSHEMLRDDEVGAIEIGPSGVQVESDSLSSKCICGHGEMKGVGRAGTI